MPNVWLTISVCLSIISVIPYARDILRGQSKPNIASWLVWTAITGVATLVQFAAGETTTAIVTLAATLESLTIVILGLRYGYAEFGRFEWLCLAGALVGLLIWLVFHQAVLAVLLMVLIDLVGSLPTYRHSWRQPFEETWLTYLMAGLAGLFGILAIPTLSTLSLAYPIYLAAMNLAVVAVVLYRLKATV